MEALEIFHQAGRLVVVELTLLHVYILTSD
jgi:hypothetical protein